MFRIMTRTLRMRKHRRIWKSGRQHSGGLGSYTSLKTRLLVKPVKQRPTSSAEDRERGDVLVERSSELERGDPAVSH